MTLPRERVLRWVPGARGAGESGLDRLRALAAGEADPPPVSLLIGLRIVAAEPGRVRMALPPAEFLYNPIGSVHGGAIASALDAAMASSVLSTLPPGRDCVTLEIKVNYLRALTEAAGEVSVEGAVVQAGRQIAVAEARMTGPDGRLYAAASSTLLVHDRAGADRTDTGPQEHVLRWDDPASGAQAGAGMAGLDYLRAMRDGELPRAPVASLMGLAIGELADGRVSMAVTPGWFLTNPGGTMHGGVIATLLDSVMGCSVHSTLPAGRGYTTLELKVNYLRAVTEAGGVVTGLGELVHIGRRVAMAAGRAVDAAGRVCATASTTCLVLDRT